jgi:hypothetical protein
VTATPTVLFSAADWRALSTSAVGLETSLDSFAENGMGMAQRPINQFILQ